MAKATLTLTDSPLGTVDVRCEFDPALTAGQAAGEEDLPEVYGMMMAALEMLIDMGEVQNMDLS